MLMAKKKNTDTDDAGIVTRSWRIPATVAKALRADAKANRRKDNDHLVWILERYLKGLQAEGGSRTGSP